MKDLREATDKDKLRMAIEHKKRKEEILYLAMLKEKRFRLIKTKQ